MEKFDTRRIHLFSKPGLYKFQLLGAILMLLVCTFSAPLKASCESQIQSGQTHLENMFEAGEPQQWSSFLPIWGEEARKRGYELPLPFGISANFYSEKQDFEVQDLDFVDDNLESGSEINAFVFSTRLGVRERINPSLIGAVWVGAMYQKVSQDFEGRVKSLNIAFKIEQEPQHPWNALIGGRLEAGQHFDFIVEGGFGGRKSILGTISYRF